MSLEERLGVLKRDDLRRCDLLNMCLLLIWLLQRLFLLFDIRRFRLLVLICYDWVDDVDWFGCLSFFLLLASSFSSFPLLFFGQNIRTIDSLNFSHKLKQIFVNSQLGYFKIVLICLIDHHLSLLSWQVSIYLLISEFLPSFQIESRDESLAQNLLIGLLFLKHGEFFLLLILLFDLPFKLVDAVKLVLCIDILDYLLKIESPFGWMDWRLRNTALSDSQRVQRAKTLFFEFFFKSSIFLDWEEAGSVVLWSVEVINFH